MAQGFEHLVPSLPRGERTSIGLEETASSIHLYAQLMRLGRGQTGRGEEKPGAASEKRAGRHLNQGPNFPTGKLPEETTWLLEDSNSVIPYSRPSSESRKQHLAQSNLHPHPLTRTF